uniref:Uncharacterized protein n=1 Tax=Tanacetum cinerariifolium TaxID=118510 RepID=A0A6L2JYH4_TANCI|nr:hypothetical protein [Tanacetum cinerariifolium]
MQMQKSKIDSGSALDVVSSQALDADLVIMESNGTKSGLHDTSSSLGNYITHVVDANIMPVNNQVPFAEVQLTAQHIVLTNEQQYTDQSKPIYDTYLLEKVDSNTSPENEKLNKGNEHLKQTYKEFFDLRIHMKDHNDSLIAQVNSKTIENANLKARFLEKVFANAALKNELRKLKGTCVDTKFAKPSILGKPVLQPHRNQSVVRQLTVFKYEQCKFSKPRFASHVDVINDLSKPVTPHYVPKFRESVFVKPHHVIASSSSRNSSNGSYGSNDMAHKYYLEVAKKKTKDKNTSLKPSVRHTTSLQNTTNISKPKPRRNNQTSTSFHVPKSSCGMSNAVPLVAHSRNSSSFSDSKYFICSTYQKCVFNANHEDCITKFLKRWTPTGRIFKTAGFMWIPTGNMFIDSTTKVYSEPPNDSNEDVTNPFECKKFLDMASADNTSGPALQRKERCTLQCALSLKEEKSSCLRPFSSTSFMLFHAHSIIKYISLGLVQNSVSPTPYVPPSKKDYEILFQQLFYFNPPPRTVSLVSVAVAAPRAVDPVSSPSSTTIDQDVSSASSSPTTQEIQSQVTHQDTMTDVNVNAHVEQAHAMAPPPQTLQDTSVNYMRKWFDLTKDTLRDALQITLVNNNNAFPSPPTPDALIYFVNNLGYPKVVRNLSAIGIVNQAQIDYAERMWEDFTQSIHSSIKDKKNLALHTQGKKKANPIVIPSIRFTKLIIHHLQRKHKFHPRPDSLLYLPYEEYILRYLKFSAKGTKWEVFGMPILIELITADIQDEQYYKEYLNKVANHQGYFVDEEGSDPDSLAPKPAKATKKSKPSAPKATPVTKPAIAQQPKPKLAPAKSQEKKCKLVTKTSDKPSLAKSSKPGGRNFKECSRCTSGPLPSVVIREPDSGKFQPLLEVQGKGKKKVSNEQVALDLLTLQTPKKVSHAKQYIFQRRTPASTKPSGHAESPSIYTELGLSDSDLESDEKVHLVLKVEAQDKGQARPNPGVLTKGQAGSNPGNDAKPQSQSSPVVHAGPNLEHIDLKSTDVSTQQNPELMDEGSPEPSTTQRQEYSHYCCQLIDQTLGYQTRHRRLPVINSPRDVTFRDKYEVQMIMQFNEIHKFSDNTLHQIDEVLDYRVKEFKVNRMNMGLNTRFWTQKDVDQSFNSLVHSLCALSTLRRSGLRTASAAVKPCQGDSSELYLIIGRILMVAAAGQSDVNSQPHAHTLNSLSKT